MSPEVIQAIGLMAPVLFLYAYAMVSFGRWHATELRFHLFNFFGALFLLISLTVQWNLPMFILESFWGSISIYGCVKALRIKKARLTTAL